MNVDTTLILGLIDSIGLTGLNTILIIGSLYLGYRTFVFQARAGIRESLEQLEDVAFNRSKLTAMLHEFDFLRSHSTVLLKYYMPGRNPASANQPTDLFHRQSPWRKSDDEEFTQERSYEAVRRHVESTDGVTSSRVDEEGIFLEISSRNAVEIRSVADKVLRNLKAKVTSNPEAFAKNFQINLRDEPEPE